MTDGELLLAAILANPACDTARLVYADWLQENGEPERAEFIRVQVELARGPAGIDCTRFTTSNGICDCFVAPGVEVPPVGASVTARVDTGHFGWALITGDVCAWTFAHHERGFALAHGSTVSNWRPELSERSNALAATHGDHWVPHVSAMWGWERGFVGHIRGIVARDWTEHFDAISSPRTRSER